MSIQHCRECGSQVSVSAKFGAHCGVGSPAASDPLAALSRPANEAKQPTSAERRRSQGGGVLAGVLACVFALLSIFTLEATAQTRTAPPFEGNDSKVKEEQTNSGTVSQDVLFGQSLALAYEDRLGVSPYLVLRALKEATWKPYPRVNAAVDTWITWAHGVYNASKPSDFARLSDAKKNEIGGLFHVAITAVVITDHRDGPIDRTTQLGQFIAAVEGEIDGLEKARLEQGLAPLKPMPTMTIAHAVDPSLHPVNAGDVQDAPVTDCDTYTATESDPQASAKAVPYEKINPTLAIPACKSAVQRYPHNSRLIFQLGRAYSKNNNISAAVSQYRKAADQGNVAAQRNLGLMYQNGEGLAKSETQALVWFRKAADQGYAPAQNDLGFMYEHGQGIAEDEGEAVAWFRKAADQGLIVAQTNLGKLYQTRQDTKPNYPEALKWYRKAADHGDAEAENNLGVMYEKGQGVSQNYPEALNWYRKAADRGNAVFQENLDALYARFPGLRQAAAAQAPTAAEKQNVDEKPDAESDDAIRERSMTIYAVFLCAILGGKEECSSTAFNADPTAQACEAHKRIMEPIVKTGVKVICLKKTTPAWESVH